MDEHLEALRRSFMPLKVSVLLVGESAPAGGTFFYLANSTLYRATREAFAAVYGLQAVAAGTEFLGFFRDCGCYLDDLCPEPVNHLPRSDRLKECERSVPGLARRLAGMKPNAIIAAKKTLDPYVRHAMSLADISDTSPRVLPHPSYGNQKRYVEGLAQCLVQLQELGVLHKPQPAS